MAHNPHAAATLAQNLDNMGFYRYTYAIFGMMRDKDIEGVIARLKDRIDHWYVTDLPSPRAASAVEIQEQLLHSGVNPVSGSESSVVTCDSPVHAYEQVQGRAGENDRIVVFGSFFTVAGVMDVVCRVEH